jgi:hypothetical protein
MSPRAVKSTGAKPPNAKDPKPTGTKDQTVPKRTLISIQAICIKLGLPRPERRIWRNKSRLLAYIDANYFPDQNSPSWDLPVEGATLKTPGSRGSVWTTDLIPSPRMYGPNSPVPAESAFFQPNSPFWNKGLSPSWGVPSTPRSFGDFK